MPKRKTATKKKRIGKRAKKKQKLTMRKHRNLYGLNMVELVTEMFRRKLPGPGLKRYQFKPNAPTILRHLVHFFKSESSRLVG